MQSDQLTRWSLICAQLRRSGVLAKVILDADCVHVEVSLGNRQIKKLLSTAEIEQAYIDIVAKELERAAVSVNHAPARRFAPWVAGGKDTE